MTSISVFQFTCVKGFRSQAAGQRSREPVNEAPFHPSGVLQQVRIYTHFAYLRMFIMLRFIYLMLILYRMTFRIFVSCPSDFKSLSPSLWMRRSSVRTVRFCSCQKSTAFTLLTYPLPLLLRSWGGPVHCCVPWTTRRATHSTFSRTAVQTFSWIL